MARGFGSTFGAGASDRIVSVATPAADGARSYHIWSYRNGAGGGNFGRFWDTQTADNTQRDQLWWDNAANRVVRYRHYGTSPGVWESFPLSTGAWTSVGVSHDIAGLAAPVFYRDGAPQSVTTTTSPSGSVTNISAPYWVGNRPLDAARAWDGMHAEFAVWDGILTQAEFSALAAGVSADQIRPANLVEYIPMVRANVSRVDAAPSITGTVVQAHPRIIRPRRRTYFIPAAAGGGDGFQPAWARNSNRVIGIAA